LGHSQVKSILPFACFQNLKELIFFQCSFEPNLPQLPGKFSTLAVTCIVIYSETNSFVKTNLEDMLLVCPLVMRMLVSPCVERSIEYNLKALKPEVKLECLAPFGSSYLAVFELSK